MRGNYGQEEKIRLDEELADLENVRRGKDGGGGVSRKMRWIEDGK
jgi:hypothetical protein